MGHILRTLVQTAWDIAQGALSLPNGHYVPDIDCPIPMVATGNPTSFIADVDTGYILAQGWINRFKGLFEEIKVHSITAHFMPYEPEDSFGEYAFGIWDYNENANPSSFLTMLGLPSSIVRKSGQPSSLVWYPTEPDDRNWHKITDTHKWCSVAIYQSEAKYNKSAQPITVGVEGKIVIEAKLTFRGKPVQPSIGRDAPADSFAFKQYQRENPCLCRKCAQVLLRRLIVSNSGSTSPFQAV